MAWYKNESFFSSPFDLEILKNSFKDSEIFWGSFRLNSIAARLQILETNLNFLTKGFRMPEYKQRYTSPNWLLYFKSFDVQSWAWFLDVSKMQFDFNQLLSLQKMHQYLFFFNFCYETNVTGRNSNILYHDTKSFKDGLRNAERCKLFLNQMEPVVCQRLNLVIDLGFTLLIENFNKLKIEKPTPYSHFNTNFQQYLINSLPNSLIFLKFEMQQNLDFVSDFKKSQERNLSFFERPAYDVQACKEKLDYLYNKARVVLTSAPFFGNFSKQNFRFVTKD